MLQQGLIDIGDRWMGERFRGTHVCLYNFNLYRVLTYRVYLFPYLLARPYVAYRTTLTEVRPFSQGPTLVRVVTPLGLHTVQVSVGQVPFLRALPPYRTTM